MGIVHLTPPQLKMLRGLASSPRRGEYVNPTSKTLAKLRSLHFVEPKQRPGSGDGPEDWWVITDAGKGYLERHG